MSEENGKVCCNCKHCIRYFDEDGTCSCKCEISGEYLHYLTVMEDWCRHWAKEKKESETDGKLSDL